MLGSKKKIRELKETIMSDEVNSVVKEFKDAHKELLSSIEDSKYTKVDKLIQKQQDILDKFFKHMKKECNIPAEAKYKESA